MKRILLLFCAVGCGASSEAPRVSKLVVADPAGIATATNDLGWEVELDVARVAMRDLEFTTEGEGHVAQLWQRTWDALVPSAVAHPGHLGGGEVIGELRGTFLADFFAEAELGTATMIESRYDGANFAFAQHDDLGGSSLDLGGTATKDGVEVAWSARVFQDDGRVVVGLPMAIDLTAEPVSELRFQLLPTAPTDDVETIFDGIDFGTAAERTIEPDSADGARLLRSTQRHDFWQVVAR